MASATSSRRLRVALGPLLMPSYISPSSSSCTLTSAALRRAETLNPTNFKRACSGGALSSVRCCAATRTCRGSSCTPSSAARAETTSTAITLGLRSGPPRTWTRRIAPASSVSTRTAFTPRNLRSTASAASVGDPPCSGTSGTFNTPLTLSRRRVGALSCLVIPRQRDSAMTLVTVPARSPRTPRRSAGTRR